MMFVGRYLLVVLLFVAPLSGRCESHSPKQTGGFEAHETKQIEQPIVQDIGAKIGAAVGAKIGAAAVGVARATHAALMESVAVLRESLIQRADYIVKSIADFMGWLTSWNKSYHELATEAKFRIEDLEEDTEELEEERRSLQELCSRHQSKAEWSECFEAKREVSTMSRRVRMKLREARKQYEHYRGKHNKWNPGNTM